MIQQTLRENRDVFAAGALTVLILLVVAAVAFGLNPDSAADVASGDGAAAGSSSRDSAAPDGPANAQATVPWLAYEDDSREGTSTDTPALISDEETDAAPSAVDVAAASTENPTTPSGPTGSSPPGPSGSNPAAPGKPSAEAVTLRGVVRHAVWGVPIAGVPVNQGIRQASTDSLGRYVFDGLASGDVVAVSVASPWLSHASKLQVVVMDDDGRTVDFHVYAPSEAYGRDWRAASWWRDAPDSTLASPVSRVSAASTAFRGLTLRRARAVLDAARNGSQEERARGELLASWLDLASGRLGFDTAVDAAEVPGGLRALPNQPRTALSLVREADQLISGGADPEWVRLRKVLSSRSLDDD